MNFSRFDASAYLDSPEAINSYLALATEDGDAKMIQLALRNIVQVEGMKSVAEKAGLKRETLERSLSADGDPSFDTVMKVTKALSLEWELTVVN